MSGRLNGVQAKIKELYPSAMYTHCMAHRLNLVVVDVVMIKEEPTICTVGGVQVTINHMLTECRINHNIRPSSNLPTVATMYNTGGVIMVRQKRYYSLLIYR